MVMPCYHYELTARDGKITPCEVLDGGVAGDRGALRLVFVTDDTAGYTYRAEAVNAAGGYDITEPMTPTNGRVSVDVPPSWMVAGITTVRLVQLEICDGEEVSRLYFSPVLVKFAYRDEGDGVAVAAPQWQEMLTRAETVLERVQEAALDASTAAELAAEYAEAASDHAGSVDLRAEEARELAQLAMNYASTIEKESRENEEQLRKDLDAIGNQALNAWTMADTANMKADELLGQMGDVDAALDSILTIQNALIGGDA